MHQLFDCPTSKLSAMRNKILTPLLTAALLLAATQSCNKEKNPLCGSNKRYVLLLSKDDMVAFSNDYMDGNNRVYNWGELVENVCADEHVKVKCTVRFYNGAPVNIIKARGRIGWQILFERKFDVQDLSDDNLELKGNGEAGLKQAFGEDPASFVPVLEVFFPTRGNLNDDNDFLFQHVLAIEIVAEYLDYKY